MQGVHISAKLTEESDPQGWNLQVVVNLPVRVLGIRCNSLTNSSPLSHLSRPRFPFLNWQLRAGEFQSTYIL